MPIDRTRLLRILDELGRRLTGPATICLIGSSPGIAAGQPDRQSMDIDIWRPRSTFDDTEFRRACADAGLLFDPKGELDPDAVYVQIVQPGIVRLPAEFKLDIVGRYGALTVVMPEPALLSATKLVRGDARDVDDVTWWIKERALDLEAIRTAVGSLPEAAQREAAGENLILLELVATKERKQ